MVHSGPFWTHLDSLRTLERKLVDPSRRLWTPLDPLGPFQLIRMRQDTCGPLRILVDASGSRKILIVYLDTFGRCGPLWVLLYPSGSLGILQLYLDPSGPL